MSERLTTRLTNGGVGYDNGEYFKVCYPWKENCLSDIDRMAIRLCELEDKIEKGDVVEVRHGEWKDRYENKYANHYYECSVCGKPALDRTVNNGLGNPRQEQALSSFCPNCGAKNGR